MGSVVAFVSIMRAPDRIVRMAIGVCMLVCSACANFVSIDYVPSNTLKGDGTVRVDGFDYLATREDRVRPRQVEANPHAFGKVYLTSKITDFFRDALTRELAFSGYTVTSDSGPSISGTIERFYLDWVGAEEQMFELVVQYRVRSHGAGVYSSVVKSVQKAQKTPRLNSVLIRQAISDCVEQFLKGAQEAGVF